MTEELFKEQLNEIKLHQEKTFEFGPYQDTLFVKREGILFSVREGMNEPIHSSGTLDQIAKELDQTYKKYLQVAENKLADAMTKLSDGEYITVQAGQNQDAMFIGRHNEQFVIREEALRNPISSVGTLKEVSSDLANSYEGKLQVDLGRFHYTPGKSLKDVLMNVEGIPQKSEVISSEQLNTGVEKYRMQNGKLEFSFVGAAKISTMKLEQPPFLSQSTKKQLLDVAASAQPAMMKARSMELGN